MNSPVVPTISPIDYIINLLDKLGWDREDDLITIGNPNRAVFSKYGKGNKLYKVIIGLMWTTYYDLNRDSIGEMDSIKTESLRELENKLRTLSKV